MLPLRILADSHKWDFNVSRSVLFIVISPNFYYEKVVIINQNKHKEKKYRCQYKYINIIVYL